MNRPLVFIVLIFLASCKPLKKLNKQFDEMQRIADKVNTLTPGRDSVVYYPGTSYFTRDTVIAQSPGNFLTREIRIIEHKRDTVVKFDVEKERSFFRENERLKAENAAHSIVQDFNDKWLRISVVANGILLLTCGVLVAFNIKRI